MPANARKFFAIHVEPAMTDWLRRQTDQRLAMNLCVALNQMAERYFLALRTGDYRLRGATSVASLRKSLAVRTPAFEIIRDLAEAHGHASFKREERQLAAADQTGRGGKDWGESRWSFGQQGDEPEIIVTLDTGQTHYFSQLAERVFAMWRLLLEDL